MGVRKWGQLTPWKMDEKLNSKNMQKTAFFGMGVGVKALTAQLCGNNGRITSEVIDRDISISHEILR